AVGEYRAPANPVEEQIAAIWCEVLGVDRIGTSDDFFDLGGHSLLATQLVARVRQTFGATASVRTLFEHPTIEEFARTLDARQQAAAPASPGMEIVAVPRDGRLPASAAQQRLWLLDRLEKGDAAYNMPVAFRVRGRLDLDALRSSFAALVGRHEILRAGFESREDQLAIVVHDTRRIDFETVRVSGDPVAGLASEASRPFDLAHDPLVRVRVLERDGVHDDHVVLLVVHHIVAD